MKLVEQLKRSIGRHHFGAVVAGNYKLSVQGSEGHYCTPRKTLDANQYVSMEMAIYNVKGKGMLNPRRSTVIKDFPRYNELISCYDGSAVFGWLPVDVI